MRNRKSGGLIGLAAVAILGLVLGSQTQGQAQQFYNWSEFYNWCVSQGGNPVPNPPRCYPPQQPGATATPTPIPPPPRLTPDPNLHDAPNDHPDTPQPPSAPPQSTTPTGPQLLDTKTCSDAILGIVPSTIVKTISDDDKNTIQTNGSTWIPSILTALKKYGINDPIQVAYVFATVNLETSRFRSLDEGQKWNEEITDKMKKAGKYIYRGRGLAQLTNRDNYERFTRYLKEEGIAADLVNDPDLALRPDIAVIILVKGMKYGLFTQNGTLDHYLPPGDPRSDDAVFWTRGLINGDRDVNPNTQKKVPPGSTAKTYGDFAVEFERSFEGVIRGACYQ